MKKACATQCAQCPFRSTSLQGWLGNYNGPGAVHTSLWHKEPFFCHTRTDYQREDWLDHAMKDGKLCLGALIFVGRDKWFPKCEDIEVQRALTWAMSQYEKSPEQFDVMEAKAFMAHHSTGESAAFFQRQRNVAWPG